MGFVLTTVCSMVALLLDQICGEPKRFHPLVGFGYFAGWLEKNLNTGSDLRKLVSGYIGLICSVALPMSVLWYLQYWLHNSIWLTAILNIIVLTFAIGWQSLITHAKAVLTPLQSGDIDNARAALSMIVSRDTKEMDTTLISGSTIESILENGHDSVFASLFWFAIAGPMGTLLHRLVNTLDAMWGYRNAQFEYFGKAAAKLDDLLGWIPARLTALIYALSSLSRKQFLIAMRSWRAQGREHKSANGGPVMASGAGALGIRIGGPVSYEGTLQDKPFLGDGRIVEPADIQSAIRLVNLGLWIWIGFLVLISSIVFLLN